MLDPRIYRAALLPVVLALIVCAFSLSDRPRPIGTTLDPDAFSGQRALTDLRDLAGAFPARRPGDSGDAALAAKLAGAFRAMGSYQVSTPSFEAENASGSSVVPMGRGRSLSENAPTISANRIGIRAAR